MRMSGICEPDDWAKLIIIGFTDVGELVTCDSSGIKSDEMVAPKRMLVREKIRDKAEGMMMVQMTVNAC